MSERLTERTEQLARALEALASVQTAGQTIVNREVMLVIDELLSELKIERK